MNYKYILPIVFLSTLYFHSVSATESSFRLANKTQNKEAHTTIRNLTSPSAKIWANSRLNYLSKELSQAQKLTENRSDAKTYRSEIASEITQIINALKMGNISFSVTDTRRAEIEKDVISYQQSFVTTMKKYLQKGLLSDIRETGSTHFTLRSKSANVTIDIDPYKVIVSKDRKNIEIDTRINTAINIEKEGSASGYIDGNIKIIGSDMYITLRDYKIGTTLIGNSESDELIKTLSEMKGKIYHQKLSSDMSDAIESAQKDPAETIKKIDQIFDILSTESLLTPLAIEGSDAILIFKKETIEKISNIFDKEIQESIDIKDMTMMIPMDIRTDGKTISICGYEEGANIQIFLSHHTDGTPLFTFEVRERGRKNPTNFTLTKTPTFWEAIGTHESYTFEAKTTSTGTVASIKDGMKTLANLKIDTNGVDAWTYDLSALWDWTKYDYDTESDVTDSIALRLWGNLRDEFGNFQVTPPSIFEELEKTTLGTKNAKEKRDQDHIENIRALRSGLESYFEKKGYYPTPKENCLDLSEIKKFIPTYYTYTDIPQTPSSECKTGYYYKIIVSNGKRTPLLASQVELKNQANYDNTLPLSKIRTTKNLSLFEEINSTDPKNWLYVLYY